MLKMLRGFFAAEQPPKEGFPRVNIEGAQRQMLPQRGQATSETAIRAWHHHPRSTCFSGPTERILRGSWRFMSRFQKASESKKWMSGLDSLQGSPERSCHVARKVKPKFPHCSMLEMPGKLHAWSGGSLIEAICAAVAEWEEQSYLRSLKPRWFHQEFRTPDMELQKLVFILLCFSFPLIR